jgi:hypothetical protein
MLAQGAILVAAPNLLLEPLGLGRSVEVWPRTVGVALVVLGLYYVRNRCTDRCLMAARS